MKDKKDNIKSGKEILDAFFSDIEQLPIDKDIASVFKTLYEQGKFTDTNIKNKLQNLRDRDATNED